MSDPDVPQSEKPTNVDDVVGSANAGLDAAAAARSDVPGGSAETIDDQHASAPVVDRAVDPDLAAFEEAERSHPGTFAQPAAAPATPLFSDADETAVMSTSTSSSNSTYRDDEPFRSGDTSRADEAYRADERSRTEDRYRTDDSSVADAAYTPSAFSDDETRVLPSEPGYAASSAPLVPQPIFVQAPEPPRDRGNRGTAAAIGLLATLVFAVLYLGATIGLGALAGDVTAANLGTAAAAPLMTWGFWTPVVVFFLGFWFLGAIINRGRWGLWVVFGIIVGVIAYGGHILGQVFEARFWTLSPSSGLELVGEQLLAPLAIAAFVFARELTIWFGAWVARSGARKTELNAEAQREYERTLEAGPTLAR